MSILLFVYNFCFAAKIAQTHYITTPITVRFNFMLFKPCKSENSCSFCSGSIKSNFRYPDCSCLILSFLLYHAPFMSFNLIVSLFKKLFHPLSQEPEKIVFHVVTDSLNFPAITMWFLLNPPTPATIDILVWDNYEQLAANFSPTEELVGIRDPAYTSTVNRLQFFLPNLFPFLHKILVLDHDVVVQRDLSWLWRIDMKGKVTCAVKMCNHQLEDLLDFTDPILSSSFDPKACVLAFGMNMFDLNEWRKQGLTASYGNWIQKVRVYLFLWLIFSPFSN